ncbi:MAG TPA: hypothetical protein VKI19_04905, partial [Acidimicrobiales bacterium]|nr:hypothetical protein [Acidimicrobiales bacterium]
MDLAPVLDELYGLDPAEFTARRDALSAEARKSGEREAATAIKALRRPSAAAYVVNLMARARENDIARLLELGGQMRQAQEALSGDDLRALGRQRQQLIGGMAGEARRLAAESGHPVSESVAREVEATFEAALADPWAGEAVRAGRLVRSLHRSGMDPVDLTGAVAGPAGAAGPPPTRAKTAGPAPTDERAKPKSRPATDERAAEAEAAARRQDAEAELARARKAESEAARRLEEATARH